MAYFNNSESVEFTGYREETSLRPVVMVAKCLDNNKPTHDVTKIQTTKLSILLRFYFHGVLEQQKTNFQTNFRLRRVLGFVIEYA